MSRVGKLPISFDKNVKVKVDDRNIFFENGKETVSYQLSSGIAIKIDNGQISLSASAKDSKEKLSSKIGMDRSNIKNIVLGLSASFKKILEINGVGYKVNIDKDMLILTLGYSHEIYYKIPKGVLAVFEKPNLLILSSHDKILLGQSSSEIISFRKTEPYKGKGIKVFGKKILRKEGKKK
jgi:large subunit ribosomal protein L6